MWLCCVALHVWLFGFVMCIVCLLCVGLFRFRSAVPPRSVPFRSVQFCCGCVCCVVVLRGFCVFLCVYVYLYVYMHEYVSVYVYASVYVDVDVCVLV